jgi:recombination protein RecA
MTEQDRQRAIRLKLARMESQPPYPSSRAGISTPWPVLDAALGIGGLPRSRIVEIFGPSGSCKTSVALRIVAWLQKNGGAAVWIDAEHAFDPGYADRLGVALARLPVVQPVSAEESFEIARQLVGSGALDLLVVDSAAALVPALELETALGAGGAGLHSRVLASGLQKLARAVAKSDASVLFLNQTRSRPEPSGGAEVSAGGPPLKLYAGLRIRLEPAGAGRVRFRILKNRPAEAFRHGELWLNPPAGTPECP